MRLEWSLAKENHLVNRTGHDPNWNLISVSLISSRAGSICCTARAEARPLGSKAQELMGFPFESACCFQTKLTGQRGTI